MANSSRAGGAPLAPKRAVPPAAAGLGGLGLIPLVAGAGLVAAGEVAWALPALIGYAASILSFMGGIHWGLAIATRDGATWLRLGVSVVPALVAWLALLVPPAASPAVLAAAFGLLLAGDLLAVRRAMAPAWYPRLRVPLTVVVIACLLGAWWV